MSVNNAANATLNYSDSSVTLMGQIVYGLAAAGTGPACRMRPAGQRLPTSVIDSGTVVSTFVDLSAHEVKFKLGSILKALY